jgi:oxygen-independent coproporphyrinogen-3 oxidase
MTGIYVHLPFCPYICPYCDFAKWPHKRSVAERYLQTLYCEIDNAIRQDDNFATVFLGGGTPNTYAAAEIAQLLARIGKTFPGPGGRETTIEVNPELVDAADLETYAGAGVTRLSIGVQSFVASEIRTLGRRHEPRDVRAAVEAARAAGMHSVSLDLIFGVPGQTPQSWRQSLEGALALNPDHVSTYGLTIEDGTPYAAWQERDPGAFPDQDAEADLYEIAIDVLQGAGFEHYEISNFARPGHRCVHNANYWANGEYVGLGVGAASFRDGVRSTHTRDLETYVTAALEGRSIPQESERLEGARRAGEAVMLALRTAQGLSFAAFKERYGLEFLEYYAPIVEPYRAAGLLEVDAAGARLTRRGRFVANDICATFITLP